jgi:sialidase-1
MARKSQIVALLILTLIVREGAALHAQALFEETEVFVGGQDDINTYRIPSLICTKNGTLLAFSEGRKEVSMDGTPTDLVLKRSLGNGSEWTPSGSPGHTKDGRSRKRDMTWLPMQTLIHSAHGEAYMNPVPLIDRANGTIYLLANLYPQPYADAPADIWLLKSTDEGATWSGPIDITASVGRHELGPGDGVQLRSGRLMVPVYDGVVFSDDHGNSWKAGGTAIGDANETQVVELVDGSLILNKRGKPRRLASKSEDHGQGWSAPKPDPNLPDFDCQGSLIRFTRTDEGYSRNRLLFANPVGDIDPAKAQVSDPRGRFNITVRLSYDEGNTWPVAKVVRKGPGAYSSMTVFPDGSIGILYETGDTYNGITDHYGKLVFARFNLEWLTDGKDHLEKRD